MRGVAAVQIRLQQGVELRPRQCSQGAGDRVGGGVRMQIERGQGNMVCRRVAVGAHLTGIGRSAVAQDAVDPGARGTDGRAVAGRVAPDQDEGFVQHGVGGIGIIQHGQRQRTHGGRFMAIQGQEGRLVTCGAGAQFGFEIKN